MNCNCFFIFMFLALFSAGHIFGQQSGFAIGIDAPDSSAILHVQPSTANQGVLIPRLSSAEVDSITAPAEGLLVFDTDKDGIVYWNSTLSSWVEVYPKGIISMWSGTTPPAGWALCNGSNGTPDLRSRFIAGYNPADSRYNNPGNISQGGSTQGEGGGLERVTLSTSNLPRHRHYTSLGTNSAGSHSHSVTYTGAASKTVEEDGRDGETAAFALTRTATTSVSGSHSHSVRGYTDYAGSSSSIENRPPYYVLAFIIKL